MIQEAEGRAHADVVEAQAHFTSAWWSCVGFRERSYEEIADELQLPLGTGKANSFARGSSCIDPEESGPNRSEVWGFCLR